MTTATMTENETLLARIAELEAKLKSAPAKKAPAAKTSIMKLCPAKSGKMMLFFTTPSMVAHSEKKDKEYQASILLQAHQVAPFLAAMKDGSLSKLAKTFIENEWSETKLTH